MSPILRTLLLFVSLLLLVTILELVRRGKLREEYSLLFLLISGLVLFFAIFRDILVEAVSFLAIGYTPSLLVGVVFFMTFAVQIAQGVIISSLSLRSRDLVQKVSELEWQVHQLRNHTRTLKEQQKGETTNWVAAVREMVTSTEGNEGELTT